MRRAFCRGFLAVVSLVAAASSSPAEPLTAARGGERWVLLAARGVARLELPDGGSLPLPLPAGAELSRLAAVEGGWVAAGTTRQGDGRGLLLLQGDAEGAQALPAPPGQRGRERAWPVLLVDQASGRLAGAAWLEGADHRSFAVHAAAWDGRGWGPVEEVAPRGPGSQLALAGTVLADGSWLLLWSSFDGHDDEIVWSLRHGVTWRPAERLSADNTVPDVVPAVVPTRHGALAAWSRYDGEGYRLRLARFAAGPAGQWQGERAAAPTGSLYPSFAGEPGRPSLLYLSVVPRGWVMAELDERGVVKRRSAVTAAPATSGTPATPQNTGLDRPIVLPGAAGGLVLRWSEPGRQTPLVWERTP